MGQGQMFCTKWAFNGQAPYLSSDNNGKSNYCARFDLGDGVTGRDSNTPLLQCYVCLSDKSEISAEENMILNNFKINTGVTDDRKIKGCNAYYSHPYGYLTYDKDCGADALDESWDFHSIATLPSYTPASLSYDWSLQDFKIKFATNSIIPSKAWITFQAKDGATLLFNHNIQPVIQSNDNPAISNSLTCKLDTVEYKYYQCQNTGTPLVEGSYTIWFKSMHVILGTHGSKENVQKQLAALSVFVCFRDDKSGSACGRSEKYVIDAPKPVTSDPEKVDEIAYADPLKYDGTEDPIIERINTSFEPQQMNAFGCMSLTFRMQKTPWYADGVLKVLYSNMGGQAPIIPTHPFSRSYCTFTNSQSKVSHDYTSCAYEQVASSSSDYPAGVEITITPKATWKAGLQHRIIWCNHVMPKYDAADPLKTPKLRMQYQLFTSATGRKGEMFSRFEHPTTKARTNTIELASPAEALKPEAKGLTGDGTDGSNYYQ